MKEYTDTEIIECLRSRQSYVVRYLSDRYLPMIRLLVSKSGGTAEDAKDIFQEGLLIMIEKTDDRRFTLNCRFKTFLYSVCKHLWNTVLEKRLAAANYLTRKLPDEEISDTGNEMDRKLYELIFRDSYESLDIISKNILRMYWDEIPPQEIADKLGYTYGYVRKKKCEAQAELTEKVRRHPDFVRIRQMEE